MSLRLEVRRRMKALSRSRWGVFAVIGLASGILLVSGMRMQERSSPSLGPLREASKDAGGLPTVWILFQRLDCVASRWKIEAWDRAAEGRRVRVAAWALDSPEGWPAGRDPVDDLDVSFEIREGPSLELSRGLRALGVGSTPAVLVVDPSGRLRRVVPGDRLRSPEDISRILITVEALDA